MCHRNRRRGHTVIFHSSNGRQDFGQELFDSMKSSQYARFSPQSVYTRGWGRNMYNSMNMKVNILVNTLGVGQKRQVSLGTNDLYSLAF